MSVELTRGLARIRLQNLRSAVSPRLSLPKSARSEFTSPFSNPAECGPIGLDRRCAPTRCDPSIRQRLGRRLGRCRPCETLKLPQRSGEGRRTRRACRFHAGAAPALGGGFRCGALCQSSWALACRRGFTMGGGEPFDGLRRSRGFRGIRRRQNADRARMNADAIVLRDLVLERLSSLGVDVAAALERAGLSSSRFTSGSTVVSTADYFAFWRAAEAFGPPDVGLRLGSEAIRDGSTSGWLPPWTPPRSVKRWQKSLDSNGCACPSACNSTLKTKKLRSRFTGCTPPRTPRRCWLIQRLHTCSGSSYGVLAEAWGRCASSSRAGERIGRRSNGFSVARLRSTPPTIGSCFRRPNFALPFASRSSAIETVFSPSSVESALANALGGIRFTEDVRNALRRIMLGGRPSVEKLAATLQMSARTLQRRLHEERTR
jgi:hypothetical protein